jgi:hypothetical protein
MIAIRLQGQLGNQLFQIGFIRYVSQILGESYTIIDDKSYGCLPDRYFSLRLRERKFSRRILNKYFFLKTRKVKEYSNWLEPSGIISELEAGVIYQGFFQSERLLGTAGTGMLFRVRKEYLKLFREKYGETLRDFKIVAVHIRLRDYLEIGDEKLGGKGLQLPLSYYASVIGQIPVDEGTRVMVISDDTGYVRANLKLNVPFTIEENSFIIDLLLLMHADILVLSNSTFSWWGAYMNTRKDRKVYAPEYWMGFKVGKTYPVDIINNGWTLVPVNQDT